MQSFIISTLSISLILVQKYNLKYCMRSFLINQYRLRIIYLFKIATNYRVFVNNKHLIIYFSKECQHIIAYVKSMTHNMT